jgi:ABC-2 type transport system ATP-binding protein
LLGVKVFNTSQRYGCVALLKGLKGVESVFSFGDAIHITGADKELNEKKVLEYLHGNGQTEVTVESIQPTIEDVFMELMQKKGH